MPEVKFFCHWPQDLIQLTQDPGMEMYSREYKAELASEWALLSEVLSFYPHIFPPSQISSELFYKFYAQVCTRCFGWGLPSTSMVPMADNHNHSDVTVVQEILNKQMHLEADKDNKYFTKTKFMNDYSICFNQAEYEGNTTNTTNIKGRYSKANFEANQQFNSVENIKIALATKAQLWDVHCIRENYQEDNDTEEENPEEMDDIVNSQNGENMEGQRNMQNNINNMI